MAKSVNGIEIGYDIAGPEGAPWVTLVHGFPFSRATWSGQVPALAADFRVLSFDLRGLGESGLGPAPQPLEAYVDDLLGLLDTLAIERTALVGLSMGGYISLRAVEKAAERFWALALCDTHCAADTDEAKLGRAAGIRKLHAGGKEEFVRGLLPKLLLRPDSRAGRELERLMLANDPVGIANGLAAMQGRTDTTAALAAIAMPTLVLTGSDDAIFPVSVAEALAAKIPGARLVVLAGAGHVSNLDQPVAFDAALGAFLREVGGLSR